MTKKEEANAAHIKDFQTAPNHDTKFFSQGPVYEKLHEFETPETKKIFSVLKKRVNYKEFRLSEDRTSKIKTPDIEKVSDVNYSDDGREAKENMNSASYRRRQEAEQKLRELQLNKSSKG